MIKRINESEFIQAFKDMNRENQFTREGLIALFDYLEDYEEDNLVPIELDVIALCCEYTEYSSVKEYLKDYDTGLNQSDYDDEIDFHQAVREYIEDQTTLIRINSEAFIIRTY